MNESSQAKVIARLVAIALICFGALAWIFGFTYANWLRFVSPKHPDPATGQVVYEKAIKGIFYVTAAQHFWASTVLPFVWLGAAAGFLVLFLTRDRQEPRKLFTEYDLATPAGRAALGVLPFVWLFAFVAGWGLMLFGDTILSLIFTGSLSPPGHAR